jgi:hypothetical protein
MPNGESKNWLRLQMALGSFYILYGNWPTIIHLYPFFIEELQKKLSKSDFERLQSKIKLVPDEDNPFLCFDENGNIYSLGKDGPQDGHAAIRAMEWLSINEPDYYD